MCVASSGITLFGVVLCRWIWSLVSFSLQWFLFRPHTLDFMSPGLYGHTRLKSLRGHMQWEKWGFTGKNFHIQTAHCSFDIFFPCQFKEETKGASSRSKSFSRFVAPSFHGSNNLKNQNSPFPTHSNVRNACEIDAFWKYIYSHTNVTSHCNICCFTFKCISYWWNRLRSFYLVHCFIVFIAFCLELRSQPHGFHTCHNQRPFHGTFAFGQGLKTPKLQNSRTQLELNETTPNSGIGQHGSTFSKARPPPGDGTSHQSAPRPSAPGSPPGDNCGEENKLEPHILYIYIIIHKLYIHMYNIYI